VDTCQMERKSVLLAPVVPHAFNNNSAASRLHYFQQWNAVAADGNALNLKHPTQHEAAPPPAALPPSCSPPVPPSLSHL
jgi:hypothetical protein